MTGPKYAAIVIGAHSVPDWYQALDRLVAVGQLAMPTMADAQHRATQAVVFAQQLAGIDIVTGGEMHRRTHNRHSPPERDAQLLLAEDPGLPGHDAVQADHAPRPRCVPPRGHLPQHIEPTIDLGLVDEFTAVSALTERPVKVTMDGPLMLSKVAYEEHCGNLAAMMLDLGRLPNHHFKLLAAVGCRDIQFDQPLFTVTDEAEVDAAIVAINSA